MALDERDARRVRGPLHDLADGVRAAADVQRPRVDAALSSAADRAAPVARRVRLRTCCRWRGSRRTSASISPSARWRTCRRTCGWSSSARAAIAALHRAGGRGSGRRRSGHVCRRGQRRRPRRALSRRALPRLRAVRRGLRARDARSVSRARSRSSPRAIPAARSSSSATASTASSSIPTPEAIGGGDRRLDADRTPRARRSAPPAASWRGDDLVGHRDRAAAQPWLTARHHRRSFRRSTRAPRSPTSSSALARAAPWKEILVVDDGSTRRHGERARSGRRARHSPSVQQGQRRVGQDRHPPRHRRVDPDPRRRRPASPRGRAAAGQPRSATTISWSARDRAQTQATAARRSGNDLLNALAGYLAERADSRSDVGIPRRAPRASARVPAPAAERLLDADDDDAGVSARRLQRALRADRGAAARRAVEDPAGARRREVLPDPAEGDHDLQPAAGSSCRSARAPSCSASSTASWTVASAVANSQRRRAAADVLGDGVSRRPRLRADFDAALRAPPASDRS